MRIVHRADVHVAVEDYGRSATKAEIFALPAYFTPDVDWRSYLSFSTQQLAFLGALDHVVDYVTRRRELEWGANLVAGETARELRAWT